LVSPPARFGHRLIRFYDEAEKLVAEGDAQFDQANAKDGEGDSYTLTTVIIATHSSSAALPASPARTSSRWP
jgi:hypothetical protein